MMEQTPVMEKTTLAFHETMDLHEIINMKTVCIMKSKMIQGLVFSKELKALMEKNAQQSIKDIDELKPFYTNSQTH